MKKYEIGDKVIVHPDDDGNTLGINKENLGKSVITGIFGDGIYNVRKIGNDFDLSATEDMLTLAAPTQKIVITTDGNETLARMYEDDKVIRRATAKCSPRDKFDFQTGAKIAFERLINEAEKEPEPAYLNGKFVAVEQIPGFIPMAGVCVGKIVTFKDGYDISGNIPVRYDRIERTRVNGSYGGSLTNTGFRFIKVEEEEETKYFTGKMIATGELGFPYSPSGNVTIGKIYDVKNGYWTDDGGNRWEHRRVKSLEDFTVTGYRFIEIKED